MKRIRAFWHALRLSWRFRNLPPEKRARLNELQGEILHFQLLTGLDAQSAADMVFRLGGVGATKRWARGDYFTRNTPEADL